MARVKNNHKFLDFDAIDGRKHMMDAIEEMTPGNTPLVLDIYILHVTFNSRE